MNHVNNLLSSENIDILALNETWLTSHNADSALSIPGFRLERSDCPDNTRKHGVALYINQKVKYTVLPCETPNTITIHLSELDTNLVGVYRPPSNLQIQDAELIFVHFLN